MIIHNGMVFRQDGSFRRGDIFIAGERFAAAGDVEAGKKKAAGSAGESGSDEGPGRLAGEKESIDAEGCYVIPGLIDIHFHGCAGYDFCDGTQEAIAAMAAYELKNGITSIHPATMTLGEDTLLEIAEAAAAYRRAGHLKGAELVGINMEGPFISASKSGAQNPAYIRKPDAGLLHSLQEASGGLLRICAIAPETEGAMEFIDACKDEIVLSIAHTAADYHTAREAFKRGVRHVTHLYNAMPPFSHREPGVVGAACDSDCMAELICDGVHVHPSVIRAAFKMFGDDRIVLISDSMRATGKPDGTYLLGGLEVTVRGSRAALTEGGAIAGSVTNLMDCLRYAVREAGIPLESAVKCAAVNPAKAAGLFAEYGSIEPGKYADLVILDRELAIRRIIKKGRTVSG